MPSDLMTLCLSGRLTLPALASDVGLRPITPADRDALAVTYLAAYQAPTCKNVAEARQEIDDTFAGAFSTLQLGVTSRRGARLSAVPGRFPPALTASAPGRTGGAGGGRRNQSGLGGV